MPDTMPGVLIDDVGSFPLRKNITKNRFFEMYPLVQKGMAQGRDIASDPNLSDFYDVVAGSLKFKIDSGIDIVNYPQHYDMHRQFLGPIEEFQREPFLIDKRYAVIPELYVVEKEAKKNFEEKGEKLRVKVCVTGAIDLYLKTDFGFNIYEDILNNLAKSVNHFLRNSILDSKYVETAVVAIDEPSLGLVDLLNVEEDDLISVLDNSVKGIAPRVQIHLHSLKAANIPMQTNGINIIAGEFAASPENMEYIKKSDLERYDRFLRAGVTRTDVDIIYGEYLNKGIEPKGEDMVEDEKTIRKRYGKAKGIFGDRITFVGPDCGLGSWPSQEVAQLLLKRTVNAIRD